MSRDDRRLGLVVLALFFAALLMASSIQNGGAGGGVTGSNLFSQTAAVTIANTNAETSAIGAGAGSVTIPAGSLVAGSLLHIRVWGIHSAAVNPTLTVRLKLNGSTILTTGAISTNNSTNQVCDLDSWVSIETAGAAGTAFAQGGWVEWNPGGNNSFSLASTSTFAINTTVSQTIDVSFQWSAASASNSLTFPIVSVDRVR